MPATKTETIEPCPRTILPKNNKVVLFACILIAWLGSTPSSAAQTSSAQSGSARSISTEKLSIELSPEAQEAIDNGVTLFFDTEYSIRTSYWLFSRSTMQHSHKFLIQRHALSKRYIVKRQDIESPRIFRSIAEATNYIAAQALILLESYDDEQNHYSMRLSLNRFDLPAPMRLHAFISKAWHLNTGWIAWRPAS